MRKTWKLALASAALVSGVAFTACSSDDEELLSGGGDTTAATGETGEVKTAISFAIPHAKTQRSTADYVQEGSDFKGMDKIWLFPFTGLSSDYVQVTSTLTGNPQNLGAIEGTGLTDGLKTYTNVVLPYGDVAFLLYGETPVSDKKNQLTASYISSPLVTGATPADITFSLKEIAEPTGKAVYSEALRALRSAMADVTAKATTAGKTTDAICQVIKNLTDGKVSSVAQKQMDYLLAALKVAGNTAGGSTEYATAIETLEEKITIAESAVSTFYTNYGDMPIALYTFDWSSTSSSDEIVMETGIIETGSKISYPTSLYYQTNAFPIDYTSGSATSGSWGDDGIWTSGSRAQISGSTTKIALNKTVNYAVGRLDVKVKASGATLTANTSEGSGDATVNVSNDGAPAFTLTGVIVGGQPASVGWDFLNTTTDWKNMIYDSEIIADAANVATAENFSTVPVSTYILGLPSATSGDVAKVKIALQLTNNGPAFYGKISSNQPSIIPTGATFYLVGTLDPTTATENEPKPKPKQVFASDYYTTANLNITTLKNAYATLPDLTTAQLEFSLKVDLTWQKGIVIDSNVGE